MRQYFWETSLLISEKAINFVLNVIRTNADGEKSQKIDTMEKI